MGQAVETIIMIFAENCFQDIHIHKYHTKSGLFTKNTFLRSKNLFI